MWSLKHAYTGIVCKQCLQTVGERKLNSSGSQLTFVKLLQTLLAYTPWILDTIVTICLREYKFFKGMWDVTQSFLSNRKPSVFTR